MILYANICPSSNPQTFRIFRYSKSTKNILQNCTKRINKKSERFLENKHSVSSFEIYSRQYKKSRGKYLQMATLGKDFVLFEFVIFIDDGWGMLFMEMIGLGVRSMTIEIFGLSKFLVCTASHVGTFSPAFDDFFPHFIFDLFISFGWDWVFLFLFSFLTSFQQSLNLWDMKASKTFAHRDYHQKI